jgi:hypothetical protein
MKRSNSNQQRERKAASQKPAVSPDRKAKHTSFTQGDEAPETFDDILLQINLKKPKSSYAFYVSEMMAREKVKSIVEASKIYPKKWQKVTASEKKKYEEMAEKDRERYAHHLELVKKHLVQKPLKQGATAYRIYLEEHIKRAIDNNEDATEAKNEAAAKWKQMTSEEKREYNEKKKDHEQFYENLKKSTSIINSYSLFVKDTLANAREKGESMTFTDVSNLWKKTKQSVKDKYVQYADELNKERANQRDLYEISFGVKPRRPLGAYKFFLMEAAKEGKLGKNPIREGPKVWKKLSEEEKEKYQRIAQKEKIVYMVKKMEYESAVKKSTPSTRPQSAFNIFTADMKDKEHPDLGKGGFFEYCYKKWNKLDEAAKKKFYDKAEATKVKAEKVKEEISGRVYNMPKRPGNSYSIFIQHSIPELKEKNPKKEVTELFKMAAGNWSNLTDKQKEKYEKLYEKSSEIYNTQVKDFQENGFYTSGETKKKSSRSYSRSTSEAKSTKRGKKSLKE